MIEIEEGCNLCDAKIIQIEVKTEKPRDAFYFSTYRAVGLRYCPKCGKNIQEKYAE